MLCFNCYNSADGVCDMHKKKNEEDFVTFTSTLSTMDEKEYLESQVTYLRKQLDKRDLFSFSVLLMMFPIFFATTLLAKYDLFIFIMFVTFVVYCKKLLKVIK